MSSDPLLKAIARGDPHCPDGQRLVRLGELTRRAAQNPRVDLRDRVRAALSNAADPQITAETDIDRFTDGQTSDPALARLQNLVRDIKPRRADLRDRVRQAISRSSLRLTPQQAAETGRRWRLIAAIAAAHVAAILLFTTLSNRDDGLGISAETFAGQRDHVVPVTTTATSWERLRLNHDDLLAPRRDEVQRELARNRAGLGTTAPAVSRMVAWLIAHQDPVSGRIGEPCVGERGIAIQALAALALLGEGGGDQTRLVRARLALGPVAAAMAGSEPLGPQALAASALALVDGALVTKDPALYLQAQAGLLRLTREMPSRPGEGGLAGLGWLALEAAEASSIPTPTGALEAARNRMARPLPFTIDSVGRVGLSAYARIVLGQRETDEVNAGLAQLAANPPTPADERLDVLSWCLAGLALHEGGGPAWTTWANGLTRTIPARLIPEGVGMARMPASAVRHSDGINGDALATAAAIIALQTPYRYLLLSRE